MLYNKNLFDIGPEDVEQLVATQAEESIYLEFKTWKSKDDISVILQSVTAFSNTHGGDVLVGIDEKRQGTAKTNKASAITGLGAEPLIVHSHIEAALADRVDPRLPQARTKLHNTAHGHVLQIRVPSSNLGPHLVRREGGFSCHRRTALGTVPMDTRELKEAFLQTSQATEKMKQDFAAGLERAQNFATVADNDRVRGRIFLQVRPLIGYVAQIQADLGKSLERTPTFYRRSDVEHMFLNRFNQFQYNLDGTGASHNGRYVQFYRNGSIECLGLHAAFFHGERHPRAYLATSCYDWLVTATEQCLAAQAEMGVSGEAFVEISLIGLLDSSFPMEYHGSFYEAKDGTYQSPFDVITVPTVRLDIEQATRVEIGAQILNALDVLAQSYGAPRFEPINF